MSVLTAPAPSPQPSAARTPHRLGLALAVICATQLMVVLDGTIVTIALPSMQGDLGLSDAGLQWVINVYGLAFGGLLLLGGRAGDLLGRRRVFVFGIALFTLASLLGGLAGTPALLLLARALQGIGAAIASPTALALISTTFPEGRPRTRAFAVYAAMSGSGAAIGLLAGGLLTEYLDWRWVFFVNIPIGLAVALVAPRVLSESERERGRFDLAGAVTSATGLAALVFGLSRAAQDGWSDPITVGSLVAAAVLLSAFVLIESRVEHPLMPLRIFADRNRAGAYGVMVCLVAAMLAMFFFLSLFVQGILGYSPLRTGLAFLPISIMIIVSAQLGSMLLPRLGARVLMSVGTSLAAVAFWWLSQVEVGASYGSDLLAPMLVLATGLGLTFVPVTLVAVSGVASHEAGLASGVLNTMQQVGGALGLAVLATIATTVTTDTLAASVPGPAALPTALTAGYTAAFQAGAVLAALAALIAVATIRVRREDLATDPAAMAHV